MFLIFLGVTQLALLHVAERVVQHAAALGVRAAVVVLDDDPAFYGGEARNCLREPAGSEEERAGAGRGGLGQGGQLASWVGSMNAQGLVQRLTANHQDRFSTIRQAAFLALGAAAPAWTALVDLQGSVRQAVEGSAAERWLLGGMLYNRAAAALSFPRRSFGKEDDVTVRVAYLFRCSVPLVAWMMCGRPSRSELEEAGLHRVELPGLQRLLLLGGAFRILQAEDTLPNQGASYPYADNEKECDDAHQGR